MSRSHGHRFANEALPDNVFDNPIAFARNLATPRQALQCVASIWDRAGARLPAADRVSGANMNATIERRGPYSVIHVTVPPPRESGDPAMIVMVGLGDGVDQFDNISYFILELGVDARTKTTKFFVVQRTHHEEHGTYLGEGPPPDPRWFANHVCDIVSRRSPQPSDGAPTVPPWYWWHVFGGASALRAFATARDMTAQVALVQREPILLLPELAESADLMFGGGTTSSVLRQFRAHLRGDPSSFGPACHALANMLASTPLGSTPANLVRAIEIVHEAHEYGTESFALEAELRERLASLGIDVRANFEHAQRLRLAARSQPHRLARGTEPPIGQTTDLSTWATLFLDTSELPHHVKRDTGTLNDQMFGACGGIHAGYTAWLGHESWAMYQIIDTRWLFPTAATADQYLRAVFPTIGESLPQIAAPQLGDVALAFGSYNAQVIVVRTGRMIIKLHVGGQGLEPSMLLPFAQRAVQRAEWMMTRYWLSVGRGNDAATCFARTPSARLFAEYPILALPEFPAAMATLGGEVAQAAQVLWQLQTQMRSQQWNTHREATRALVRTLLDDRTSDSRVNAAHAYALIAEIRRLDNDPAWTQLEAECFTR